MFRGFLIGSIAILVAGCGPSRQELFLDAHDTCMNYGFRSGTPEYGHCMMQKDQQQAAAQAQRRAHVQQSLSNMQQQLAAQEPVRMAPRTCTSRPGGFGTVVTDCQ